MMDTYRQAPGLNYSLLKTIDVSPKAFAHARNNPPESKGVLIDGHRIHVSTLEPAVWRRTVKVMPEGMRRGNSKAYKEFCAEYEGKEIVTEAEFQKYLGIRESILAHPEARRLLTSRGTEKERAVFWKYRGLAMKSKIDWRNRRAVRRPHMGDLKSAVSINRHKFFAQATELHYPAQAWFYQSAEAYETGERLPWYWIAAEKKAPYDVAVFSACDAVLSYGKSLIDRWIDELLAAQDSGHWPGQAEEIIPFELPGRIGHDTTQDLIIHEE
jgi:hypothetical protein